MDYAESLGYEFIFMKSDPEEIEKFIVALDEPYPFDLNITLKSFQLRGFNYVKDLPSAIINWSTGTGKSVLAISVSKYLLERGDVTKVLVMSKRHNKINWQRSYEAFAGLESVTDAVPSTTATKMREARSELYRGNQIIILNYEKMSGDEKELTEAIAGEKVLWVWDEMPNKMKSMQTKWYKAAQRLLKVTKDNRQLELTAKKLDTDPENVYSCVKILDPTIWPNLATFRTLYARSMNPFNQFKVATWHHDKLHELGMRLAHMTHIVNKYTDPEVMKEFPKDQWETIYVDMSDKDRKLYDIVKKAILEDEDGEEKHVSAMQKVLPLQLMCNNPALMNQSTSELAKYLVQHHTFNDKSCAKLEALRDLLEQIDGQVVIFSRFNDFGSRMLTDYLKAWNFSYVLYDGSEKQMQQAQDLFKNNPFIKIFLSSDKGSDSINLQEATSVVNYDLPWNHSTLIQRVNRISRLTSTAEYVSFYNLVVANTVEEKILQILEMKKLYEDLIDEPLEENSSLINSGYSLADLLA
jgi:SNF2 family DNA or RNA helicase